MVKVQIDLPSMVWFKMKYWITYTWSEVDVLICYVYTDNKQKIRIFVFDCTQVDR
jgi:hypothetical protein